jgi:hypothetical protein
MPTKKTMNRYRLKIQPIWSDEYSDSWFVERYDSKTAAVLMRPKTESMAQKEPKTTSQAWSPPSGKSKLVSCCVSTTPSPPASGAGAGASTSSLLVERRGAAGAELEFGFGAGAAFSGS